MKKIITGYAVWEIGKNWEMLKDIFKCEYQAKKYIKENPNKNLSITEFPLLTKSS